MPLGTQIMWAETPCQWQIGEQKNCIILKLNATTYLTNTARRIRIIASKRLRKKHELYEKIIYFYSVLILVLSIWFISDVTESSENIIITKILLILSISLTFFTMYVNIRNYKERASAFETNYRNLDIILNRMDRLEVNPKQIDVTKLKELHCEYEKLLIEKENHQDIDFMTSKKDLKEKFKNEIWWYKFKSIITNIAVACYPIILLLIIYMVHSFFYLFSLISKLQKVFEKYMIN